MMENRTREKIALVVFVLLVAFAGVVLTSYFTTGRSWSVAASFVDDTVGSMDGYTAIVYAGVVEPDDADAERAENAAGAEAAERAEAAADVEGAEADGGAVGGAGSLGLDILALLPPVQGEEEQRVYVSDVRSLYERKGARALTLDVGDADYYATPRICYVGGVTGKKIGVFSVDGYATTARIASYLEYFRENRVDAVVCLTPYSGFLSTLKGIDAVIVTGNADDVGTSGETRGSTFVVRSPDEGAVGVVLLTTNNVPSARVVEAL